MKERGMKERRMKAVIFIRSMAQRGGTEIVAENLCQALNEAGKVECSILSAEPYSGIDPQVRSLSRNGIASPASQREIGEELQQWVVREGVDAIINFTHELIPLTARLKGVKRLAVHHWSLEGYEDSILKLASQKHWPLSALAKWMAERRYANVHKAMGTLDCNVALTQAGAEELCRITEGKAKASVIPNFLPYSTPAKKISGLRNGRAVYVGRLSKEKGIWHLLDIWERLSEETPGMELCIYGEGHERKALENAVAKRGLPRVRFMGFESDAEKIYTSADMLLCPSETEGFGMVLIEAMHYGVVPVAFDCPVSPKELIGEAGLTTPCFDTELFARKAKKLLAEPERLKALQAKGLERTKEFYRERVIEKWHNLLLERNT